MEHTKFCNGGYSLKRTASLILTWFALVFFKTIKSNLSFISPQVSTLTLSPILWHNWRNQWSLISLIGVFKLSEFWYTSWLHFSKQINEVILRFFKTLIADPLLSPHQVSWRCPRSRNEPKKIEAFLIFELPCVAFADYWRGKTGALIHATI